MDYQNAIEINNLCKAFKGFTLDNVSLSITKGTIMGFVGQNGAGKSTTIKAILNIIKNDSGTISVFGMDHIANERKIKQRIAAVFDENPFNDVLNAKEINAIMRRIYSKWEPHTFMNYLERFGLPINKAIGQFSKGMKMKLQIDAALSHNAELLIMDEPTSGLDPVVRNEILDVFEEYVKDGNHTIFLSSHITSDLERIADSITYIHNGRIILSDTKENILRSYKTLEDVLLSYVNAQSRTEWHEGRIV